MDKQGASLGLKVVVLGILLLVIFIAVSTAFGFGFKKVFDQTKELLGFPSGQLEELKKLSAEVKEEVESMCKLLNDAAINIKNGKSDEAINNYIQYYNNRYSPDREGRGAPCPGIAGAEIKFRLLSALREKFFVSKSVIDYDKLTNINKIFRREEVDPAVLLIKAAIELDKGNLDSARNYLKEYEELYWGDKEYGFNIGYNNILLGYYNVKASGTTSPCKNLLESFIQIRDFINNNLSPFEYKDPNKPILKAVDYQFINVLYEDAKKLCKPL